MKPSVKSIQAHILDWLNRMKVQNFSPKSIQTHQYRFHRFTAYFEASGLEDVRLVGRDYLNRYWHGVQNLPKPLSLNSLGGEVRVVKSFFGYLLANGQIKADPSVVLTDPSHGVSLPKAAPTYEDVKKILNQPNLATLEGIRDRAWLELLFSSAIRVGECEALLLGDVDLQDGVVRVRHGKGDKERLCPLGTHASRYVRLYLEQSRPYYRLVAKTDWDSLFLGRKGGRLRAGDMRRTMRIYRQRVGVSALATPHGLRRAAATGMISRAGKQAADTGAVQALLGHARISTTNLYAQVQGEDLKAVHQTLHPRAGSVEKIPAASLLRVKPCHV